MYETIHPQISKFLKYNVIFNLLDASFFGFGFGFASLVTVLPLFVSRMTDSAILIGLIPAIHSMGWQFPQLLTANHVARQRQFKPMVLAMTIHERVPFLGLAAIAWFGARINVQIALLLTFVFLIWQGLGGGLTATAWQSMIGKIIPSERRGTFFGTQSSAANLLSSLGAILAGIILDRLGSPLDFTLLFLLAALAMAISWVLLAQTREPEFALAGQSLSTGEFWSNLVAILKRDRNFRWFLVMRMLSQGAIMAFAFYAVYAVRQHGLSELEVSLMTGVLLGVQIVANPLLGWIGDRWGHRLAMLSGIIASILSALLAWWAPDPGWFYAVFTFAGIGIAATWTVALAMVQDFGLETERPAYIGLGNTLVAPATILAPLLGGWLADSAGYPTAFLASALAGLLTLIILVFFMRDPRRQTAKRLTAAYTD
jgi:MFS family permease